jgi:3-hydroxy-9,10-secoandrosta-1,3,5(10)-triene-9,17-dione monooxygenase reductase component
MHGAAIDPKRFRSVMGTFPTGVAVIGTAWDGKLFGATINSLTSVSLAPCMLLFCTNEGSATGTAIRKRGLFSVNILGAHQSDLSMRFTGKQKNRFEDIAIGFSADGLPPLEGAATLLQRRYDPQGRRPRHHSGPGAVRRREPLQPAGLPQGEVWKFPPRLTAV